MCAKANKKIVLQGGFAAEDFDRLKKKGIKEVFVLEGRPKLDAMQQTCDQLLRRRIKPVIISDNMAGFLFAKNMVKEVWASYQLADEKGAVCRIGSLVLAVLGKRHKVPVYLFKSDQRTKFMGKPEDLFYFRGERVAPSGVRAYVPLVEWVPKRYVSRRYE
jgi:methylthioribose-1-phosphate isomerase